jgi:hypothetical protein
MSPWLASVQAKTAAQLAAHGRSKLLFYLGSPEQAKADDDDPTGGVSFEVFTKRDGTVVAALADVLVGSGQDPAHLLGAWWVEPPNWSETAPAEYDSDGERSAQDTRDWALMYGLKSWANTTLMLRGRLEPAREVERPLAAVWEWLAADKQGVPDVHKVVAKVYTCTCPKGDPCACFPGDVLEQVTVWEAGGEAAPSGASFE